MKGKKIFRKINVRKMNVRARQCQENAMSGGCNVRDVQEFEPEPCDLIVHTSDSDAGNQSYCDLYTSVNDALPFFFNETLFFFNIQNLINIARNILQNTHPLVYSKYSLKFKV